MGISVHDQLRQLTAAAVTGGGIGIAYDLLRTLTEGRKGASLWLIIWALASAAALSTVSHASGAGPRLFFLCAAGAGACLYEWALSPMVRGDLRAAKHDLHFYATKRRIRAVSKDK